MPFTWFRRPEDDEPPKPIEDPRDDKSLSVVLTFDDAILIAKGCFDYSGGHHSDGHLEAYHHGIQTVINALEGAAKTGMTDLQSKVLHRIGGGQDVEFPPSLHDIVNS